MKINEQKSGILRILKKNGKIGKIENSLNIPEVESYKYLGVQINQFIRTDTHHKYIKQKVEGLKRRINLLKPSLISMKSRLTLCKTIITPQLSYV